MRLPSSNFRLVANRFNSLKWKSTKIMEDNIPFKVQLNNGIEMPIFGLGTYRMQKETVQYPVECALRVGYRSIDTAAYYRNEEYIAQTLKKVLPEFGLERKDIFITTKLPPSHHGTDKCEEIFNTSLKNLDVDYIDLYLIHWPGVAGHNVDDSELIKLRRETWLKMEQLYLQGKMRAIGVSNYTVKHLDELLSYCTVKPAVNQVEYHPHLIQTELYNYCKNKGIHLQAYSSLGSTSTTELLRDEVVNDVAQKLNRSAAQVLLRWAVQQNIGIIPKASTLEHIKDNYQIWDFTIPSEEMVRLNNLNKFEHYCWNPDSVA